MSEVEPVGVGERTIVKVRTEMAKPEDMQCVAVVKKKQCQNDKTFVADFDYWSGLCLDHYVEEQEARKSDKPRVAKKR